MKAYIYLPIAVFLLVGCAGTLNQRAAQSCPGSIPAPVLQVGDSWGWQDEKGAGWHRTYVQQTDEGLLELDSRPRGARLFYDKAHTLRKVLRDGAWITHPTLDYPEVGLVYLDFPLHQGKSWSGVIQARDSNQNLILTYRKTFTVLGCEQVNVPAGTFFAVVIEERQDIQSAPGSGVRTYWYAPDANYFVKLVHGQASHSSYWSTARDWALTRYQLSGAAATRSPGFAAPVSPSDAPPTVLTPPASVISPSPTSPVTRPAPNVTMPPTSASLPVWAKGYEWKYRWTSPRGSGTYVWNVADGVVVGGVPYYVVQSGSREIYYSRNEFAWLMERVEGAVEVRGTPANRQFDWPLIVGKEWESKSLWENLTERSTEDRHRYYKVEAVESVSVPAGTFHAFHVTSKDPTGRLIHEFWYSPEVKWVVKERNYLSYGVRERELIGYKLAPTVASLP